MQPNAARYRNRNKQTDRATPHDSQHGNTNHLVNRISAHTARREKQSRGGGQYRNNDHRSSSAKKGLIKIGKARKASIAALNAEVIASIEFSIVISYCLTPFT